MLNSLSLLLMQAEDGARPDNSLYMILPPLAIIFVLYMVMDAPQRRERSKRESLIKNLKKDDRVVTIGGIIGTVANISQDGKEVTLKVDEGTRIRFRRTAIDSVLTGDVTPDTTKAT